MWSALIPVGISVVEALVQGEKQGKTKKEVLRAMIRAAIQAAPGALLPAGQAAPSDQEILGGIQAVFDLMQQNGGVQAAPAAKWYLVQATLVQQIQLPAGLLQASPLALPPPAMPAQ